jgi:hypothetical protein
MKQRVPRRSWQCAGPAGHRPRILIEDDEPALAISDFSLFQQAGFDVAFCSGPGADPASCPLLRGEQCHALAQADAVLHGLDPRLGVAASIHQRLPGTPVLVKQRCLADGSTQPVPAGCLPLAPECSVRGQMEALRRALAGTSCLADTRRSSP